MNRKELESLNELDFIEKRSFEKPQVIFKHSTRCGVSRMALKPFEKEDAAATYTFDFYYLDLLTYRTISNEIAARFNVVHQSPQVLLIKNGKCIYSASHSDIDIQELQRLSS